MALTKRRRMFALEYLANGANATEAAKAAGYAARNAHVEGHRLLRDAKVREFIEERMGERADRLELNARDVGEAQLGAGRLARLDPEVAPGDPVARRAGGTRPRDLPQIIRDVNPALRRLDVLGERPAVTGSRSGGEALASLLQALQAIGLITDKTTP